MITLYDLVFDKDMRPSPYCWRTKLAMKHKGLVWRDEPMGFTEKQKIAFADATTVPVIHDGTKVVKDSWAIALHLDETYPDKPLFPNDADKAYARFVNGWADAVVNPLLFPLVVADLVDSVRLQDKAYIIESRGKRLGTTDFAAFQKSARDKGTGALRLALEPARRMLGEQPFLSGATPAYADYILYGSLLWPQTISPRFELLDKDDPVHAWHDRMVAATQ